MSRFLIDQYFSNEELSEMKFKNLGNNVKISKTARLYIPEYISIGDNSIIDDFCILSGNIEIGRNVHIAHGCRVVAGREGLKMHDFSGLAFGVTVFAQSDDYSGEALTNPTVPMKFRKIQRARVEIGRHVIVGTNSVIFPGVMMGEGSSVGACSMVTKSTEPWTVYLGQPAKKIKERKKTMLGLESDYLLEAP